MTKRLAFLAVLTVAVALVALFLRPADPLARLAAICAIPTALLLVIGGDRGWYRKGRAGHVRPGLLGGSAIVAVVGTGLITGFHHGFLVFLAVCLEISVITHLIAISVLRRGEH